MPRLHDGTCSELVEAFLHSLRFEGSNTTVPDEDCSCCEPNALEVTIAAGLSDLATNERFRSQFLRRNGMTAIQAMLTSRSSSKQLVGLRVLEAMSCVNAIQETCHRLVLPESCHAASYASALFSSGQLAIVQVVSELAGDRHVIRDRMRVRAAAAELLATWLEAGGPLAEAVHAAVANPACPPPALLAEALLRCCAPGLRAVGGRLLAALAASTAAAPGPAPGLTTPGLGPSARDGGPNDPGCSTYALGTGHPGPGPTTNGLGPGPPGQAHASSTAPMQQQQLLLVLQRLALAAEKEVEEHMAGTALGSGCELQLHGKEGRVNHQAENIAWDDANLCSSRGQRGGGGRNLMGCLKYGDMWGHGLSGDEGSGFIAWDQVAGQTGDETDEEQHEESDLVNEEGDEEVDLADEKDDLADDEDDLADEEHDLADEEGDLANEEDNLADEELEGNSDLGPCPALSALTEAVWALAASVQGWALLCRSGAAATHQHCCATTFGLHACGGSREDNTDVERGNTSRSRPCCSVHRKAEPGQDGTPGWHPGARANSGASPRASAAGCPSAGPGARPGASSVGCASCNPGASLGARPSASPGARPGRNPGPGPSASCSSWEWAAVWPLGAILQEDLSAWAELVDGAAAVAERTARGTELSGCCRARVELTQRWLCMAHGLADPAALSTARRCPPRL